MGFDFEIDYKLSLENKADDARLRQGVLCCILALTVPTPIQLEQIYGEVENDPKLKKIREYLQTDKGSHPAYTVVQERLLFLEKLVVPRHSQMIGLIIKELHDDKLGAHAGVVKTHKKIYELFY